MLEAALYMFWVEWAMAGLTHILHRGEQRRMLRAAVSGVTWADRQHAAQSQQSASEGMRQGATCTAALRPSLC